jgi:flagellar assembly protein FliH
MKTAAVNLQIPLAVGSIRILNPNITNSETIADSREVAEMKRKLDQLSKALDKAVEQIDTYGQNLFVIHRDKIVHLAVQIAARILAREIEEGHYEMENILTQAIAHAPLGQAVEIHLNPEDLKTCEAWLENEQTALSHEVKLTADGSVPRAECIVLTPEGIMEYRINEHLKQIESAMTKQNSMIENKN